MRLLLCMTTTPSRAAGRSWHWQGGTVQCSMLVLTTLASWRESPCCHLPAWRSLWKAKAAGAACQGAGMLLCSQAPVWGVITVKVAGHLLTSTVGWEQKWWEVKEMADGLAIRHGKQFVLPWQVWNSSATGTQPPKCHLNSSTQMWSNTKTKPGWIWILRLE